MKLHGSPYVNKLHWQWIYMSYMHYAWMDIDLPHYTGHEITVNCILHFLFIQDIMVEVGHKIFGKFLIP